MFLRASRSYLYQSVRSPLRFTYGSQVFRGFASEVESETDGDISNPTINSEDEPVPRSDSSYDSELGESHDEMEYADEQEDGREHYRRIHHIIQELPDLIDTDSETEDSLRASEQSSSRSNQFSEQDQMIFSIIKKHNNPEKIWRRIEEEELVNNMSNRHFYPLMKLSNKNNNPDFVITLLDRLKSRDLIPSKSSLHQVVIAMINSNKFDRALELINELRQTGMQPALQTKLVISKQYNQNIQEACSNAEPDSARNQLRNMIAGGYHPTKKTLQQVFNLYLQRDLLAQAQHVLHQAATIGLTLSPEYYSQLLNIHLAKGDGQSVQLLFEEMGGDSVCPTVEQFQTAVQALTTTNQTQTVKEIRNLMQYFADAKSFKRQLEERMS